MIKFVIVGVIIVVSFLFLVDPAIKAGRYLGTKLKEMWNENPDI